MANEDRQRSNIHIGGSVKGDNVVIGSTQTIHGDLRITVGAMPTASEDVRQELLQQIAQLLKKLEAVPADHTDDVLAVQMAAEGAVAEAKKEQPEKRRLVIQGKNLKKAAEHLATVMPAVLPIATQVVATLLRIG